MTDAVNPVPENADYEDRVLIYMDVLGWSELIARSVDDESARAVLAKISSTLRFPVDGMEKSIRRGDDFYGIRVSQFSDTLVMSTLAGKRGQLTSILVLAIGTVQVVVNNGHHVRGAVVRGKLIHRPDVIYGPALVEAYKIEKDVAKYPRIIIAPAARELVQKARPDGSQIICDDRDGLQFLDVFTPHLYSAEERRATRHDLREQIRKKSSDLGIVAKHSWTLSYLDEIERRTLEVVMPWLNEDRKGRKRKS
jgi:hypothetical protein